MKYTRVKLRETSYQKTDNWKYINNIDVDHLNTIYKQYCEYKNFNSVMPIFEIQYRDPNTDIIGYFHQEELVAFSLVKLYDDKNAELLQFAWNYKNPELLLGLESLKNECAVYKDRGYEYLYLGSDEQYKRFLDGFEIVGKL
jgi:hypothetical protein